MSENIKLQLKKIINAKRNRIFEAWTKPEVMMQWYHGPGMTTPSASSDLKVGGKYHVEMKGEREGKIVNPIFAGEYTKIIPNELISFTFGWQHDPSSPKTQVTVELKDVAGGTEVILTHERFPNTQACDDHRLGWNASLASLEKFLT